MKRKLFALVLCGFAILLLMGAAREDDLQPAPLVSSTRTEVPAAPVEKPVDQIQQVSDETQPESPAGSETDPTGENPAGEESPEADPTGESPAGEETPKPDPWDRTLLLDGQPVPKEASKVILDGVTYVSLKVMSQLLDPTAQVLWDEESSTITVTTEKLTITATLEKQYIVANERYLYLPEGLQLVEGQAMIPLKLLARAFDAQVGWDEELSLVTVTTGSGAIVPGEEFYNEDDLFWLSRVIYAESGNQTLTGMIGVGNVVLNRVNSEDFPDTILEVLAQKNQFSTYHSGALADRTPNKRSVIAAKLVMDGAVVEGLEVALYFDGSPNSWAARHRTCIAVIDGHNFYD